MAVLWVHEGYQKNFDRKVKKYAEELQDISDQYNSALKLVGSYGGSSIDNCEIYLKKRKKALAAKISEAETIQKTAHTYVAGVISADGTIARSIHTQSYDFYHAKGIGPQKDTFGARAWNTIQTTAKDFWCDTKETTREVVADIKEFYEEHKYIVNLVFDVLAIFGAAALFALSGGTLFGIICAIGAVWALSKAMYETATDVLALHAHLEGDEEKAEDLSKRTLAGAMVDWGEALDQKWGTHFMETSMKVLTIGLEVCEFVVSMVMVFESFKKIFKLDELASLNLQKCGYRTWNQNKYYLSLIKWGETAKMPRFKSALNWTKFGLYTLGFSFSKNAEDFKDLLSWKDIKNNSEVVKDFVGGKPLTESSPLTKPAIGLGGDIAEILAM